MDGGKDILHFLVWDYEGICTYFFAASFVAHAKRATMVGKPEACEFLTYCQIMKNGAAAPEGNENEFKSTKTGVI